MEPLEICVVALAVVIAVLAAACLHMRGRKA